MKVKHKSLIDSAKEARGIAVIIDVFRASTTAGFILKNEASKILPVKSVEEAFYLKKKNPDFIIVGERNGIKIKGFDFGNSPTDINRINLKNKTVIFTTSAGTQGIINANNADEIILGNFVNAEAIIKYLTKRNKPVTLVGMGISGTKKCDEDELCCKYLKNRLEKKPDDFNSIKKHLKNYKTSLKFFDKDKPEFPEKDFDYALDLNRFNFIIKTKIENNRIIIFKEDM